MGKNDQLTIKFYALGRRLGCGRIRGSRHPRSSDHSWREHCALTTPRAAAAMRVAVADHLRRNAASTTRGSARHAS
eukprot:3437037-Amphidinium_carterae.1